MFADRAAQRPLLQAASTLRSAFGWWTGELAGLVPQRLRRRLGSMRGQLFLILDGERADLVYEGAGRREMLARLPSSSTDLEASQRTLALLRRRRREAEAAATICLPEEVALRRTIALPLAAAGNLAQVVFFELDRHTPFKRDDVYFAHRLLKRDAEARQLQVELTVVPRAVVTEALRTAGDLGLEVAAVRVGGAPGLADASPNILPESQRPKNRRWTGRALAALGAITALLAIAALAIPFVQIQIEAGDLEQQVAVAKQKAEASLRLQRDIDTTVEDSHSLVQRKQQKVPVSDVLLSLTELMPDNTWITTLEISGSELRISGYSSSATEVLGILDRSSAFSNAAFRASVTQDTRLNREQFNIAAQIRGEKPK
jgi:general secretion pathway protein L